MLGLSFQRKKQRTPWFGPHKIIEKLPDLGCIIKRVANGAEERALVNRLKRSSTIQDESGDPMEGMFPQSFRILRIIIGSRGIENNKKFKLRSVCINNFIWVNEFEVLEVLTAAYDLKLSNRNARE